MLCLTLVHRIFYMCVPFCVHVHKLVLVKKIWFLDLTAWLACVCSDVLGIDLIYYRCKWMSDWKLMFKYLPHNSIKFYYILDLLLICKRKNTYKYLPLHTQICSWKHLLYKHKNIGATDMTWIFTLVWRCPRKPKSGHGRLNEHTERKKRLDSERRDENGRRGRW